MTKKEQKIFDRLIGWECKPQNKGFRYSIYAALEILKDESLLNHITTKLYPLIAVRFEDTPSKVERAIRHIVCSSKLLNKELDRPTNGAFLAYLYYTIK